MDQEEFEKMQAMAEVEGYPKAVLFVIDKRAAIHKEAEEVRKQLKALESEGENCLFMIDTVFDHMKENNPEEYAKCQVEGRGETRIKFVYGKRVWDVRQDRGYPDNICCRIRVNSEDIDVIEINE